MRSELSWRNDYLRRYHCSAGCPKRTPGKLFPGGEHGIGDGCRFTRGLEVMHTQDVGAGEHGSDIAGERGIAARETGWRGRRLHGLHGADGFAEKALARQADEQRTAELVQMGEIGEQGEVFRAEFAEGEAWIEHDGFTADACGFGQSETF